jgi:hypothetical protein
MIPFSWGPPRRILRVPWGIPQRHPQDMENHRDIREGDAPGPPPSRPPRGGTET